MKQLPDILASATFWASVGTLWAASGAWFTYVASAVRDRQQTHDGVLNLIEGLEAELELASDWTGGSEGNQGYLKKTRIELIKEHPDWFNPSRMVFTFATPTLSNLTNSPYAKSTGTMIKPFVLLNHSIRRLFDYMERYRKFVMGDVALYQSVLEKFAPKTTPIDLALSKTPETIVVTLPYKIPWTHQERAYINNIFMMNEAIHQNLIGGEDLADPICLYKAFRIARKELNKFKASYRRERLPRWYWALHVIAGWLALNGAWQILRWFGG